MIQVIKCYFLVWQFVIFGARVYSTGSKDVNERAFPGLSSSFLARVVECPKLSVTDVDVSDRVGMVANSRFT